MKPNKPITKRQQRDGVAAKPKAAKPRSGAAWRCLYKRFPTKLSTENVSQAAVNKRAGAGRCARGGLRKLRHNPPLLSSCAE